ncbi:PstS family phosphate ABC transporter substrate-binding protein [Thermoleptolyngbya sp. C42_A2020_037]|uniref:PstS family phosphate ABC transporter substrate-binding protein n=1 Tax=Thermoleptolyngbya sp. C42_A2020_037 TaxID=2747799 RepID=UPI001A038D20|nr:PstS family phosphate ABC transporter substrate-binding protein [Thermoleptolyngbya sp. C42_A2020_037]MBF2083751.1 PstS family phosphate ABC transporter substrate-binding protein [Thermoleptolyngbya sp. C42_A2020_037]
MAFNLRSKRSATLAALTAASLALAVACGGTTTTGGGTTTAQSPAAGGGTSDLTGSVLVDGSSTVFPISEAMAEEFMKANPGVRVTVGVSGTGGGFKKFCAGETDISNASRPIKQEEIDLCAKNGIEYVEVPIAYDGLSVVINPSNEFATCLTVDELKKMWEPAAQGTVRNWNQIRPGFPDLPLGLYGPGTDSGTYDYFTAAIVGEEGESRGDFTASEDDNVIVQGVASDPGGLGFFGFAYYEENRDRLKLVEIDNGNGCVAPSAETIADGTYTPLSRPEFFYIKTTSLDNPAVAAFARFQIDPANAGLISEVGYVPLPTEIEDLAEARIEQRKTGSVFGGSPAVGLKLVDLLKKE